MASRVSNRDREQIKTAIGEKCCSIFQQLTRCVARHSKCFFKGMTLSLILLAAQVLVTIFALVRESGDDPRFEGEKLMYRS